MTDYPLNKLEYKGRASKFFLIWIVNILLSIITLGIYSFWGKVRMRKYGLRNVFLLGEPFEYTGNGKELFIGFLKALPIIVGLYAPFIIFDPHKNPWVNVMFFPILYFFHVGSYAAMRYRLSRTTWRGIRGALTGSAFAYANEAIGRSLINIVTLGFAIPYSDIKMKKYMVEHMYFGSVQAHFDGVGKKLMKTHITTLLLAIPTLGLSRIWYQAALMRYWLSSTTIHSTRVLAYYTGGKLFRQSMGNIFILIFTAGLGAPIVWNRRFRFFTSNVALYGNLDVAAISQSAETVPASGEGLDAVLGDGFMS